MKYNVRPILDRLSDRTIFGECWVCTMAPTDGGYVQVSLYEHHRLIRIQRWSYEFFIGPIPEGCVVDHVQEKGCTSPACWNPEHLEAVTPEENLRRQIHPVKEVSICPRGHERERQGVRAQWVCRVCKNERERMQKRKRIRKAIG